MKTILFYFILLLMYPGERQILLFYNEEGSVLKNKQVALLNDNKEGLKERDIIIHVYNINGEAAEVKKWHIKTATPFTFILIGKDGGEKIRSDSVVSAKQLFSTIDAMPMRKEEMKQQRK